MIGRIVCPGFLGAAFAALLLFSGCGNTADSNSGDVLVWDFGRHEIHSGSEVPQIGDTASDTASDMDLAVPDSFPELSDLRDTSEAGLLEASPNQDEADDCVAVCTGFPFCGPDDGCGGRCGCPDGYSCAPVKPSLCVPDCEVLCKERECGSAGLEGECVCPGPKRGCDDTNPCTRDFCSEAGRCAHEPDNQGTCFDGDPCTVGDFCEAGVCKAGVGTVDCDDGDPCTDDLCGPGGICLHTQMRCDDQDLCNGVSICQDGVCTQTVPPVLCLALDACHLAGTCNPATGLCDNPIGNEGAGCDDGDACNGVSTCHGGLCVQTAAPVVCEAADSCHVAGTCNPGTGQCSNPVGNDGSRCNDDGNLCNGVSTCQGGLCAQTVAPVVCKAADSCHLAGTCNPATGLCSNPAGNEGAGCEDGDACTEPDLCALGKCVPGKNRCGCLLDDDCSKFEDGDYCNGLLYCNVLRTPAKCEMKPKSVVTCAVDSDTFCSHNACNPAVGLCYQTPRNEGSSCQKDCVLEPVCQAGECKGKTCLQAGMTCASGKCVSRTCTPGTRICDGDFHYMVCNSLGNDWLAPTQCPGSQFCEAGACRQQICTPGAPACAGQFAGTCNSAGGGLLPGYTNCWGLPTNHTCQAGLCLPCTPTCTGKQCGNDECGRPCGVCGEDFSCVGNFCVTEDFTYVPAGTFWMGSPGGCPAPDGYPGVCAAELGRSTLEILHKVTLTRAFEVQTKEVTQAEWKDAWAGWNPSFLQKCGDACPIEQVNWYEALAFANWKSEQAGLTPCYVFQTTTCADGTPAVTKYQECMNATRRGISTSTISFPAGVSTPHQCAGYRLMTESEWEYAARAGSTTAFYSSASNNGSISGTGMSPLDINLDKIAWYGGNSGVSYTGGTACSTWYSGAPPYCGAHPTGTKEANAWGLFDMSGNVWEWCWDRYGAYPTGVSIDPVGASSGSYRMLRGGSWQAGAEQNRVAYRSKTTPASRSQYYGFRLVRTLGK